MTDAQHAAQTDDNSPLAGLVKIGAVLATGACIFVVLVSFAALTAPGGGGLNAIGPLVALVVATPVFFIFVLPALLFSFLGGLRGAKVGAGFLVAGVLAVCLVFMRVLA
jgi:hypothetical protein